MTRLRDEVKRKRVRVWKEEAIFLHSEKKTHAARVKTKRPRTKKKRSLPARLARGGPLDARAQHLVALLDGQGGDREEGRGDQGGAGGGGPEGAGGEGPAAAAAAAAAAAGRAPSGERGAAREEAEGAAGGPRRAPVAAASRSFFFGISGKNALEVVRNGGPGKKELRQSRKKEWEDAKREGRE